MRRLKFAVVSRQILLPLMLPWVPLVVQCFVLFKWIIAFGDEDGIFGLQQQLPGDRSALVAKRREVRALDGFSRVFKVMGVDIAIVRAVIGESGGT